jgi:hypothetical protein
MLDEGVWILWQVTSKPYGDAQANLLTDSSFRRNLWSVEVVLLHSKI